MIIMKKLLLLTLSLCFTISTSKATNITDLKVQTATLYQEKLKDYPNIALTEQRFKEVIANPENKDKLAEIYKSRIEFLSNEHKLKRNEYLSKNLIDFTKKVFPYMYDPEREDMVEYRQKSLANFNRYLYEVSNLDKSFDDMLQVFYSIQGSGDNYGLTLFTPNILLQCNSMAGWCDDVYNPKYADYYDRTLWKKYNKAYVFQEPNKKRYTILWLGKEYGFASGVEKNEMLDFVSNLTDDNFDARGGFSFLSFLGYENPKTKIKITLDYLNIWETGDMYLGKY